MYNIQITSKKRLKPRSIRDLNNRQIALCLTLIVHHGTAILTLQTNIHSYLISGQANLA